MVPFLIVVALVLLIIMLDDRLTLIANTLDELVTAIKEVAEG